MRYAAFAMLLMVSATSLAHDAPAQDARIALVLIAQQHADDLGKTIADVRARTSGSV